MVSFDGEQLLQLELHYLNFPLWLPRLAISLSSTEMCWT